jgi:hypothetical protein
MANFQSKTLEQTPNEDEELDEWWVSSLENIAFNSVDLAASGTNELIAQAAPVYTLERQSERFVVSPRLN